MDLQKPKLMYQQICETIRAEAKQFEPGYFLGTEISYAKKFNVSRPTVRKAVDCLINEGIVSRIAGIGLEVTHKERKEVFDKKLLISVETLEADDGLFTKIVMGAINTANDYGYGYHILNNLESDEKYNTFKNLDLSSYIGVITTAYDTPNDKKILQLLKNANVKFVLVDNPIEGGIYNYVVADDYAGGYLIGEHLMKLNHKRILFLANAWPAVTVTNRQKGLSDALKQNGLFLNEKDIVKVDYESLAQNYILENALKPEFDYTAIVTSNDIISMHCINAFDVLGIKVPQEISITGFGDYRIASMMRHPLTTIKVPGYKMGTEAAKLILESNLVNKYHKIILDIELVIRETTDMAKDIETSKAI